MDDMTLNEEIVLLTVWKLKKDAYGVKLRQAISKTTGRIFPYGTLYSVLAKLVKKGFLTKSIGDPLPERGGRSRNYYYVTPDGTKALQTALELKTALWDSVSEITFERG